MSHSRASSYCKSRGGELAEVTSRHQQRTLTHLLERKIQRIDAATVSTLRHYVDVQSTTIGTYGHCQLYGSDTLKSATL